MSDPNEKREEAIKRVEAKRAFRFHAAIYGVVNLLLIVVWGPDGRSWDISGPSGRSSGGIIGFRYSGHLPRISGRLPAEADLRRTKSGAKWSGAHERRTARSGLVPYSIADRFDSVKEKGKPTLPWAAQSGGFSTT